MDEQCLEFFPEYDETGMRIDAFLADKIEDISRSYIQKLSQQGNISVISGHSSNNTSDTTDTNDAKSVKASYKIKENDIIKIIIPKPEKLSIEAENIPVDIVYEDDDLIIVNKPQGMVVHPAAGNYTGTLVNALMYHCGDSLSSINGVERPGIVHRIDKDTSGLLVICKTNTAHQSLAIQFAEHTINRIYSAVVYNHFDTTKMTISSDSIATDDNNSINTSQGLSQLPEELSGLYTLTINGAIARAKNDRKKMALDPSGKRAVTHVYLVENLKDNMAYVKCKLETGRTHQIRVHLTSINHPLLGDPVYGPKKCPYNLKGQALHAGTLGFIHPRTGEYMEFSSELPDYFTKILKNPTK